MQLKFKYITSIFIILIISGCVSNGTNPWERPTTYKPAEEKPSSLSSTNRWSGTNPEEQAKQNDDEFYEWYKNLRKNDKITPTQNNQALQIDKSYENHLPPIKVAFLAPLSGKYSHLGNALLNSAQLALFDMAPSSFELIPRDTKGTTEGAKNAAKSAINAGAQIILGPLFSSSTKAIKPIIRSSRINMISFSTDWSLSDYNTFVMGFMPFPQVNRIINYAIANNYKKIGVFAPQTDYGNAVISTYRKIAYNAGISATDIVQFPPYKTNISPLLRSFTLYDERVEAMNQKIRPLKEQLKKDPENLEIVEKIRELEKNGDTYGEMPFDAILLPVGGEQAISIANLLSFYDLTPDKVKRLGLGLWDDEALATEKNLDNSWFAAPSPHLRKKFNKRYQEIYHESSPRLATLAYDATALTILLAKNSYKQTGAINFTRASLIDPNGFTGIDGIFRFHSNGLIERGLAILEYKNGKIEVLEKAPTTFQNYQY